MLGRVISSQTINGNATIDINHLDAGVYVLQLVSDRVRTQKIVVK